jgi:hypothetical protein
MDNMEMARLGAHSFSDPGYRLRLLLHLVGWHSALVGVGLICRPALLFADLGFAPLSEPFFPVQGGVFHVVMAVGYFMAARDLEQNRSLVVFAIVVKALATVFLLTYWLLVSRLPLVLASGLGDGAMGLLLALGYRTWRQGHIKGGAR